ncbi:MAG: hypothetical protein JSW07_02435 [bacterium]|nr:MAG: hypothetical protein JSW07_02435 [bacterium]
MNKDRIVVSTRFKKSFRKINEYLTDNQSFRFAKGIDNLKKVLSIFPESFSIVIFDKSCEILFRKAVIARNFIVVYLYQKEKYILSICFMLPKIGNQNYLVIK